MRKLLFLAGAMLLAHAAQAAQAGKIIFVAGNATIAANAAVLDAPVGEGELLSTGADGYIYIKTIDNGLFILRPNTQARIASYHVDAANPVNTRIKLELISGVARSQSGQAVKLARQNFRFNTPVAAIGVRGTDFTVFTDSDTSRVTVLSGGITMSGFAGACRPEGTGPCEGNAARELSAAQKGQLLQVQRGQSAPQLLQGNSSLAPDVVAPPRVDEPGKNSGGGTASTTEPSLDPKKDLTLKAEKANQEAQVAANVPGKTGPDVGESKPPYLEVTPTPPDPVVTLPPKEVSWGRWTAIADQPATSGLSKAGAERLGTTEDFVLFRSRSGSTFATPVQGSMAFVMNSGEAYVRDTSTKEKVAATLSNGELSFDFGKATFATKFDVTTKAADSFKMASTGRVGADGLFSSTIFGIPSENMSVTGALNSLNGATYIFQGSPDAGRHMINGVTTWTK
ncbi:FecR-like protein [Janthinobacterium sp. HH01]|uniref:FecR family protein n=1 Tax=Janthinobacterium sp. HH01 TaxID=1198452 RepID=UPI0002AED7B4|nr:FecR family protein [Janthinobacterium sp. HH01]ELX10623.1 FecR-like protein [Janthinobacterium sp. HH01]